jgi:dihydrofolate synthase / folylpolyglutamate synthase
VTYEESLAWLYKTQQFGIKLGLENIERLLKALGDPRERLRFFHVAGTNGKGSVCAMLDAMLRAAGLRTGLYTSPHLVDFRERIRVDGRKIPPQAVAEGLTILREISFGWDHSPTFFEIATALALWHFAVERCDFVVLETGLGGTLDATNAVRPLVAVLTPIAIDHTRWLGSTVAEIAGEKAGIIKPGVPVVSARQETEAVQVLVQRAKGAGSSLEFIDAPVEQGEIGLRGIHQRANAALAIAALQAARVMVPQVAMKRGLREVHWPGRFQVVDERIVLDGCHNPHAARQLLVNWREAYGLEKATLIFGALSDKDYSTMLKILEPISREVFFVPISSERAATPDNLAAVCETRHRIFPSVKGALDASPGRTLVTGSLFLVGEALDSLGIRV